MSEQSNQHESRNQTPRETSQSMVTDYGWTEEKRTPSAKRLGPIIDKALKQIPAGGRVLDVGCGRGDQASRIHAAGFRVTGIDPAATGVEIARRKCPEGRFEVEEANLDLLDRIGEAPFDAVVSTEVCEHVYDPFVWAQGCYKALRPGGLIVVSTPYHGYIKNLVISLKNGWDAHWTPLWVGGHIKFWSRSTLTELMEQTGFEVIEFKYCGRRAPLWMSMVCIARKPLDSSPSD